MATWESVRTHTLTNTYVWTCTHKEHFSWCERRDGKYILLNKSYHFRANIPLYSSDLSLSRLAHMVKTMLVESHNDCTCECTSREHRPSHQAAGWCAHLYRKLNYERLKFRQPFSGGLLRRRQLNFHSEYLLIYTYSHSDSQCRIHIENAHEHEWRDQKMPPTTHEFTSLPYTPFKFVSSFESFSR